MKPIRDPAPVALLGARLKTLRRQAHLTQQAVADRLQVDRTTYTKYETGRVSPDSQGLLKLAGLFGVTVDALLGHEGSAQAPLALADGPGAVLALTLQEQTLMQLFRQLPKPQQQEVFEQMMAAARRRNENR